MILFFLHTKVPGKSFCLISTYSFNGSRQVLWNSNLIPFFKIFPLTRNNSEKEKKKRNKSIVEYYLGQNVIHFYFAVETKVL